MSRYQNNLTGSAWPLCALLLIVGMSIAAGCASQPVSSARTIYEAGLNMVRLSRIRLDIQCASRHPDDNGGRHLFGGPRPRNGGTRSPPAFGQADQTRAFRKARSPRCRLFQWRWRWLSRQNVCTPL
jgi:hypothetical protein